MADFCYDCIQDVFPEALKEDNDMTNPNQGKQLRFDVCEGCGIGFFNQEGKRINADNSRKETVSTEG